MRRSLRSVKAAFSLVDIWLKRDPRGALGGPGGAQGAQKVGGSAPHINIFASINTGFPEIKIKKS